MVFYGKKIKVCHVIPTLRFGGAEKLVVLFAKHFDPTRFELTVATIIESGPLSADLRMMGSRHAEFHKRGLGLRLLFNLYRFFRAEKFDVVHTHLFGGDAWGRLAAWLARTPVIISTEHNFNLDEGRLKHFWKWFSQGMIDKEVAVSEAVKNYSIEVDKINPRKIIVIRNGIEVERFSRLPTVHFGGAIHFGIIGRLEEQKGHLWALDAFSKIANRDWDLTIIGEGSLKSAIQDRVTLLHLRDKVKFIGVTNDIPAAMEKLDCVVMPSRWEGLGLSAMEAQASGRLVIASQVGGLPEIIKDGETGILVEPENVEALAAALAAPFANPVYARTLAQRARERALAEFDIREMVRRYETLYLEAGG